MPAGRAEPGWEQDTVHGIWDSAANWKDWSRWLWPEAAHVVEPVAAAAKAAFCAATRMADVSQREERFRETLEQAQRDLEKVAES